jgi:hypothetical protein
VAVWTQQPQILYSVIIADAVQMVQLENEWAPVPLENFAHGARVRKAAGGNKALLELQAVCIRASLDKNFREWNRRRPRMMVAAQKTHA